MSVISVSFPIPRHLRTGGGLIDVKNPAGELAAYRQSIVGVVRKCTSGINANPRGDSGCPEILIFHRLQNSLRGVPDRDRIALGLRRGKPQSLNHWI